jgi:translocation and assembly module TamA
LGRIGRSFVLAALLGLVCALAAPRAFAADHNQPKAAIEGVADKDLRRRIEEAIDTVDKPSVSRFDARRRANEAAEQVVAVLRSEGYYDYDVVPDATDADPPAAVVRVVPGPRYHVGAVGLDWLKPPLDPKVGDAALASVGLKRGDAGRATDVLASEGRIVSALAQRGYADAKPGERRVVVDHADHTVNPTFRIDAGALVLLDGIQVETTGRTNPQWVASLAPWRAGDAYSPNRVAELERRLRDTLVYQQITVALAPADKVNAQGQRPVVVSLADRAPATIEAGVGYSTSEGGGVDVAYNRYNQLGRADTITLIARYARIDRRLGAQIALPHWRRPGLTLTVGSDAYDQTTPAYRRTGFDLRADLKQRIGKTSFYDFGLTAEYDRNRQDDFNPRTGLLTPVDLKLAILTANANLNLDRSDDPLNPTRGWKVVAEADPTLVSGDRPVTFLRTQAQGSAYLPLDKGARTVLAGRVRLGSILNGSLADVPIDRRFYAGGSGSVRGYGYQKVGPILPNGQPQGGLSLVEASVELRRAVLPHWGVVAFADAGSIGSTAAPDFSHLNAGFGFGVRYLLPFAPVRADIAFPLDRPRGEPTFQLYVSIGQAF